MFENLPFLFAAIIIKQLGEHQVINLQLVYFCILQGQGETSTGRLRIRN